MSRQTFSYDTTLTRESILFPQQDFIRSPFHAHHLKVTELRGGKVEQPQPDWVVGVFILAFILLAWTQVFYNKRVRQIFQAPFSQRFINQLTRDGNLFRERVSIALVIVYLLAFSLFIFEFNNQFLHLTIPPFLGFRQYLLILGITLGFFTIKVLFMQLLGTIFKTREITGSYLLNMLVFALLSGPAMLILLLFIAFLKLPFLFYFGISIIAILMIFRFLRSFYIGLTLTKFSYLLLFVYLCTLEILPLLVLIRILLNLAEPA